MAVPLRSGSSTVALYRERHLPPPPFPNYQKKQTQTSTKILRNGHRPPPTSVGTVAEPLATATSSQYAAPRGSQCSIRSLGWSIDGKRLASSASDRTIRIWTPERSVDPRATNELLGHTDAVEQISWNPVHTEQLVSASGDRTVKFWDIRTPTGLTQSVATPGANINVAYHPQASYVAVGDREDTVSLIDARMGKLLGLIRSKGSVPNSLQTTEAEKKASGQYVEREEINEFSWTPNGNLFCLGTGGGSIRLLDARDIQPQEIESSSLTNTGAGALRWPLVHTIVGHTASVFCLKFDPLGRYMATSSADSTTAIWSIDEWFNVSMAGNLSHPPRSISFSHDGEFLAAGGEDPFINITATAPMNAGDLDNPLHKIPVSTAVNGIAWHPLRYYLAYAGDDRDGTIRIWGMP